MVAVDQDGLVVVVVAVRWNNGNNCTGGGGGGGSGSISLAYTSASVGNTGTAGGAAPVPASLPPEHVSGHGGASQNGLAVISMTVPGSLEIIGTVSGTSTNITSLSSATTLSEPSFLVASGVDYNVTIRLRGGTPPGNGGQGSYVQGTFTAKAGKSYRLHYDTRYSAVFYGTSAVGNNCIMLAAEGGYEGYPSTQTYASPHPSPPSSKPAGGKAGLPNGSIGSNLNTSYGGTGGSVSGYKSGSGGTGGNAGGDLSASRGGDGAFFSSGAGGSGVDGNGGAGGMGYYGGGGGGGGWDNDYNEGGYFGGGGGGGASYVGGLPNPSQNSSSPAEVIVSNPSNGNESGGTQIQIISVAEA